MSWERERLERRIEAWHRDGVVDDAGRARLLDAASKGPPPHAPRDKASSDASRSGAQAVGDGQATVDGGQSEVDARHAIERSADNLFVSTTAFFTEVSARYAALVGRLEDEASTTPGHAKHANADVARVDRKATDANDDVARGDRRTTDTSDGANADEDAVQSRDIVEDHDVEDATDVEDDADATNDDQDAPSPADRRPGRFGGPRVPVAHAQPMGALQVFWFIGAVLVLAGSLMGVREAWRSLEGAMRPLVIAGALFAYHVAFIVLARVLARRSEVTGRVLGVIAIGLAPVAFVAVAVAAGMTRVLGIGSGAVLLAATCATFFVVGSVFARGAFAGLVMGLLPCLALEIPLGGEQASLTRLLVPLAGLLPLALGAVRARVAVVRGAGKKGSSSTTVARTSEVSAQVLASLAGGAYGAIVLALYALFGGPNEATLDIGSFGAPLLACVAWIGLASIIGWFAMAGGAIAERLPRAAPVLRIVMLAVLTGAALTGAVSALGAGRDRLIAQGVLAFAPSAVAALATLALFIEQRRHALALHFAVPIAHVAIALDAFVLTDRGAPYWIASTALVPAALLLLSPLARTRTRRTGVALWSAASSIIATFVTLGLEPSVSTSASAPTFTPYIVTACTAAFLALAAHVGGRTARPSQHYLGAVLALIATCAWSIPTRAESAWFTIGLVLDAMAIAYGVAALAFGLLPTTTRPTTTTKPARTAREAFDLRPLDDISLIAALLSVYLGWIALGPGPLPSRGLELDAVGALLPTAIAAGVLALRSLRDRSRLVTLHAGLGLGVALQLGALAMTAGSFASTFATTAAAGARSASSTALASSSRATLSSIAAPAALVAGLAALLLIVPATLRRAPTPDAPRFGRPIFGVLPLPLGAQGRTVLDGFGLAAVVFAAIGAARGVQWIAAGVYDTTERGLVVLGLVAIIVAILGAFLTRGLDVLRARGNVVSLAVGGGVIALTAIAYRIGRPLPPAVVGWRLSLVLTGVWLLARLAVWKGPWLAEALERPSHGSRYHFVVHAGVLALAALLLVDALLVGAPTATRVLAITPPTLMLGGALGMFLLYRSSGWRPFLHVGLGALLLFAGLAFAQGHVLGPELEPLDPPGGRWMLASRVSAVRAAELAQATGSWTVTFSSAWLDPTVFLARGDSALGLGARAIVGASLETAVCAALLLAFTRARAAKRMLASTLLGHEDEADRIEDALLIWTCAGAGVTAFAIAWQPSVIGAALLVAAGIVAAFARSRPLRALALVLAAPMMLHAVAHLRVSDVTTNLPANVPTWAAPSIAALALLVVIAGVLASQRSASRRDPALLLATQAIALVYGVFAVEYAFATGGTMTSTGAFSRVLDLAQNAVDGRFAESYSLAASLLTLSLASAIAAWSWRGALARITSIVPALLFGSAAATAAATCVYTTPNDGWPRVVTRDGPLVGAALGMAALAAHVTAIVLTTRGREDATWGTRIGRDVLLLAGALAMTVYLLAGESGGLEPSLLGLTALGTLVAVAVHAVGRDDSVRHVYFVELVALIVYAFATRAMSLRPEVDALIGLGYGFTLLGVAALARRRERTRVADATRRFLAVLPVLVAALTLRGPVSNATATFAVGASFLYFVVALSEGSRAFGSLAAIAANVALLTFAMAQGLDGVEIWLGPLGLLVAAISQIFAAKLSAAARSAVRITGGALLYLPSGLKLALRLGAAEDATYSVVFGAVCLLGVVAGVALKVRAYLALATLSLTLDVVANLVYAGLRDHRVGFVLLSASGLFILGVMILVTLRRERARALAVDVRSRWRDWD